MALTGPCRLLGVLFVPVMPPPRLRSVLLIIHNVFDGGPPGKDRRCVPRNQPVLDAISLTLKDVGVEKNPCDAQIRQIRTRR